MRFYLSMVFPGDVDVLGPKISFKKQWSGLVFLDPSSKPQPLDDCRKY